MSRKSLNPYQREKAIDRIMEYLVTDHGTMEGVLSVDDEARLARLRFCDDQLRRNLTRKSVAEMIRKRYPHPDGSAMSESMAYRIINETMHVFGTTATINKNYMRQRGIDMCLDTYRMAQEKQDLKAMNAAIKNMAEIAGLNKEDSGQLPLDILDRIQVNLQINPALLGAKPIGWDEVNALLQELNLKPQTRTIDITEGQ